MTGYSPDENGAVLHARTPRGEVVFVPVSRADLIEILKEVNELRAASR